MSKSKASKRTTAPTAGVATSTSKPSELRECMIMVVLIESQPSLFQPFTPDHAGTTGWAGMLLDYADIRGKIVRPRFQIVTEDPSTAGHYRVVRDLQNLAFQDGFSHCEVRNYFYGLEDRYETVFNGPLRDQEVAA